MNKIQRTFQQWRLDLFQACHQEDESNGKKITCIVTVHSHRHVTAFTPSDANSICRWDVFGYSSGIWVQVRNSDSDQHNKVAISFTIN